MRADERDVVFRVGQTLLCGRFLIVRRAIAVHVALANEGALALTVADGGEDLGRRVNRAVPAARGGSDADGSPDDLVVRSSSVGRVGELRDARVSQLAGDLQIALQSDAYLGFCRKGDLVEPVEELKLLTEGEVQVLRGMRVGVDEAVGAELAVGSSGVGRRWAAHPGIRKSPFCSLTSCAAWSTQPSDRSRSSTSSGATLRSTKAITPASSTPIKVSDRYSVSVSETAWIAVP